MPNNEHEITYKSLLMAEEAMRVLESLGPFSVRSDQINLRNIRTNYAELIKVISIVDYLDWRQEQLNAKPF